MRKRHLLHIMILVSVAFVSCIKVDFTDIGKIVLVTSWDNRTVTVNIPGNYYVKMGDNDVQTVSGEVNILPELIPGDYRLLVYHEAYKIAIADGVASAEITDGYVNPQIGWFFTNSQNTTIAKDGSGSIRADMVQQVRQFSVVLKVKDDPTSILSVTAEIEGVATQLDINSGKEIGTPSKIKITFDRNAKVLTGAGQLIGINESSQQKALILITYRDGSQQTIHIDFTSFLTGFNTNKHIPLLITSDMSIATETGYQATIINWQVVEENIIAN